MLSEVSKKKPSKIWNFSFFIFPPSVKNQRFGDLENQLKQQNLLPKYYARCCIHIQIWEFGIC